MMSDKTRKILLVVVSLCIVLLVTLGISYAFMRGDEQEEVSVITTVDVSSCAKVALKDAESVAINLDAAHPMSQNAALNTTPYTFEINSTCDTLVGFNLYFTLLADNTLNAEYIRYAITEVGTKNVLISGLVSEAVDGTGDFDENEIAQLKSKLEGDYSTIYRVYSEDIISPSTTKYDLYLWIDEDVTNETMGGLTFKMAVLAKSYNRNPLFADVILENYTEDGSNGIYYHDGVGTYTNAELEVGDNSYRFVGADPSNYVCFGSTEDTCPEDNLYRIIGVFGNQVKLIKADLVNEAHIGVSQADQTNLTFATSSWSNYKGSLSTVPLYYWSGLDSNQSNLWRNSSLNTIALNSTYVTYLGDLWMDKIATTSWKVGGNTLANIRDVNAKTAYTNELVSSAESTTYNAEIGLMYVSDYMYGADPMYWTSVGYNDAATGDYRDAFDANWMALGANEWTILRLSDTANSAFFVSDAGYLGNNDVNSSSAVRPVFYLQSDVAYGGTGDGTKNNPYRIDVGA